MKLKSGPIWELLKSPWEALKGLPGKAWKAFQEAPKKEVWRGLYVGLGRVPKGGARKAIILNSRGPGWAWNTIILGVSKPTQKCPEGRVWLGAQALKSGPGTLEKPRFWRGTQGHPSTQGSLPSSWIFALKIHSTRAREMVQNTSKYFQTLKIAQLWVLVEWWNNLEREVRRVGTSLK